MARKSILIMLGIVLLGFVFRAFMITKVSMYGDELTMVYDVYSLLKTGKDSTGKPYPITFAMGAGRQGGYVYGSLPFVYLFGPTELGIRSLSILSGLGIIILMYFLGKKIFDSERLGLLASFFTSISIWDIYLSRGGFEAHFALFLALLGITLFLYKKYIPMAIVWGLATLTYPTFKLTIPLIFVVLLWWSHDFKTLIKNKIFVVSVIILTIFGTLVLSETVRSGSEQRFSTINIFSDSGLKGQITQNIELERNFSTLPNIIKPIFYNKPLEYSRILFEDYIANLTPQFLYLRGDGNPRHNPGEWGMLYLAELPLLLFGIFSLIKKNKKVLILLVTWITTVPLATMLLGIPHGLRNDFMIPPFILISTYAFFELPKSFKRLFTISIVIQLIFILVTIYWLAPNKFSNFWSYPAKLASESALVNKSKYDYVFISTNFDNAEYAYQVYAMVDPQIVSSQFGKFTKIEGNDFKKYDNVYIGYVPNPSVKSFIARLNGKVLFINSFTEGRLDTLNN